MEEIRNATCNRISEEVIERHAMGHFADPSVQMHIDACSSCRERLSECCSHIAVMKRASLELKQSGSSRGQRGKCIVTKISHDLI
jgi:hypothetical protein